MVDKKLWRYVLATSILEVIIAIVIAFIIIMFFPEITLWVIIGTVAVMVVYIWLSYYIYKPIATQDTIELEDELIGKQGLSITDLSPRGQVKIRSRLWSARSTSGFIASGTAIKVIKMEGIHLIVQAIQE